MAVGIHKPGQGYWVRVLTACYLGVIVLAAAAWCASQAKLVLDTVPKSTFEVALASQTGTVAPGQTVGVMRASPANPEAFDQVGTARVASFDEANRRIRLTDVTTTDASGAMEWDSTSRLQIAPAAAGAPPVFSGSYNGRYVDGVAAIEPVILQGIVGGVVIVVGAFLIFMFAAWKPKSVDFLIATDMEMRKVNWSTRKDVIGSTWVVILTATLLAIGLFVVDYGFKTLFQQIGILVK
jgi:preprotein translocase SecE subunit